MVKKENKVVRGQEGQLVMLVRRVLEETKDLEVYKDIKESKVRLVHKVQRDLLVHKEKKVHKVLLVNKVQ
mgnify:CR=1 FL=1